MRLFRALSFVLIAFGAAAQSRSDGAPVARKGAHTIVAPAGPKGGIKTPGVLIPFAALKAEAEIPGIAPAWSTVADALIVPNAQGALIKIDSRSNKPGDAVPELTKACGGAVTAFTSLWVPDCEKGTLARVEPKTWKSTAKLDTGTSDTGPSVAATADSVWAFTDSKTTLSRIDPDLAVIVSQLRLESTCNTLTFGETALWVTCPSDAAVLRINPETNLVEKRIDVSAQPQALALGETSIWVLCLKEGKVERIDPKTNKITKTIELETPGATQGGIAVGGGFVWVTVDGFPLTRIDPATDKVVQQFWGEGGGAIQFGFNSIWLSNLKSGTLWRIDPKRVQATLAE